MKYYDFKKILDVKSMLTLENRRAIVTKTLSVNFVNEKLSMVNYYY